MMNANSDCSCIGRRRKTSRWQWLQIVLFLQYLNYFIAFCSFQSSFSWNFYLSSHPPLTKFFSQQNYSIKRRFFYVDYMIRKSTTCILLREHSRRQNFTCTLVDINFNICLLILSKSVWVSKWFSWTVPYEMFFDRVSVCLLKFIGNELATFISDSTRFYRSNKLHNSCSTARESIFELKAVWITRALQH